MLRIVAAHLEQHGYPPSFRELLDLTGLRSTNGIREILLALERKGLIRRVARSARTISLTFAGRSALQ